MEINNAISPLVIIPLLALGLVKSFSKISAPRGQPLPIRYHAFLLLCSVLSIWLLLSSHTHLRHHMAHERKDCQIKIPNTNTLLHTSSVEAGRRIDPKVGEQVTGVIVEVMKKASLPLVLHQFFVNMGPEAQLVLWYSKENKDYIQRILRGQYDGVTTNKTQIKIFKQWSTHNSTLLADRFKAGKLKLEEFNKSRFGKVFEDHYHGSSWYNQLFTSREFYAKFNTTFALTMQSDTIFCRPLSSNYLNHTYIGGLSNFKTDWQNYPPETIEITPNPTPNSIVKSHINGGFSLRHVGWANECIETFGEVRDVLGEDHFFTYCQHWLQSSKPVLETSAYGFSSDCGYSMCHDVPDTLDAGSTDKKVDNWWITRIKSSTNKRVCPLGVHKPWHYRKKEKCQEYQELVNYCPEIAALEQLNFVFL